MFAAVTKLFDRNFAVGYFLPASIFGLAHVGLFWPDLALGAALRDQQSLLAQNLMTVVGLATFGCWLIAVSLLAANNKILDVRQGYGLLEREGSPWLRHQRQRYDRLKKDRDRHQELLQGQQGRGEELEPKLLEAYILSAHDFARRYPEKRDHVLPLAFGNTLRASQSYPWEMYGFDAINGWKRLLAVFSPDFRALIDAAKAQMDFLVNLWLLSLVFCVESAIHLAWSDHRIASGVALAAAIGSAALASHWSVRAAEDYGEMAKAGFDVFLPALREKLGLPLPASREKERAQWTGFSQAILYHRVECLPEPAAKEPVGEPAGGPGESESRPYGAPPPQTAEPHPAETTESLGSPS